MASISCQDAMETFINILEAICGANHVITAKNKTAAYTQAQRGRYQGDCLAVALPGTVTEVSRTVALCNEYNVGLVPQGGNTGNVGGATAKQNQLIVNLKRLNQILNVDPTNFTITAQAGCVLSDIQDAAKQHNRYFPLSLGSEGSCQIGGNLATNAGGINVLHYGNTRDLTLGIQVVLADGRIFDDLNTLRKNNAGYDLKNLFIGSEGTLGIITAGVLKLFPHQNEQIIALVGLTSVDAGLDLLSQLKSDTNNRVMSFELMSGVCLRTVVDNINGQRDPFDEKFPWYILTIVSSSSPDPALKPAIVKTLSKAYFNKKIKDSVIAESLEQCQELTSLRELAVEAQRFIGESIKHDIAVPLSKIPEFIESASNAIIKILPTAIIYLFGHLGDGNLHFNVSQPPQLSKDEFLSYRSHINRCVHDMTYRFNGTFSAEHGIGLSKLDELERYKTDIELELYRKMKRLLDPTNILNPGKVLKLEHDKQV